jgi:S1-C subfamily serine protease
MNQTRISLLFIALVTISLSCATTTYIAKTNKILINSYPAGADIYAGPSKSSLGWTGLKTPYTQFTVDKNWETACFQVKRQGYHDSEVICRSRDSSDRSVYFDLDGITHVSLPKRYFGAPNKDSVPPSDRLPIDGIWEGPLGGKFRIERGRMYSSTPSESRPVGMILAIDIAQSNARTYTCRLTIFNNVSRVFLGYVGGEIKVLGDSSLGVEYFPDSSRDFQGAYNEYTKVSLDDESWYLANIQPRETRKPQEVTQRILLGTAWPVPSGYVVTNYHVIHDSKRITLIRSDGVKMSASVEVRDPANDLVLLRPTNLKELPPALPLAAASMGMGASVFTIGYPHPDVMGAKAKLTNGTISSVFGLHDDPRTYQISVPLHSGNSGGPLLNMNGEVTGVVTSKLSAIKMFKWTGDLPQNVSYAVKIQYVKPLLEFVTKSHKHNTLPRKKGSLEELAARIKDSVLIVVAE